MLTTLKTFLAGLMLAGLVMDNLAIAQNETESQIITLTNNCRVKNGRDRLTVNPVLQQVASLHAQNMARLDKYGDTDKNGHILFGKNFENRVADAGYTNRLLSENVAAYRGEADPGSRAITQWTNSPGHLAHILAAEATEFGVGAAQGQSGKWYFVQVFGCSPAATPNIPRGPAGPYNGPVIEVQKLPSPGIPQGPASRYKGRVIEVQKVPSRRDLEKAQ